MSDLTLVHLVSASYDTVPVEQFATAYRLHDAGIPHRLLLLLNGIDKVRARTHLAALDNIEFDVMPVPRSVIDLRSYIVAAKRLPSGRLCFLNSHAAPLADGWLRRLDEASRAPGTGLVGATGSWEAPARPTPWSRWPRFPNPHVRTNAFVIDRDLMTSLWWPAVKSKRQAWELESGRRSVTRQVQAEGLGVLVVGRQGVFAPDDWPSSRTFRSGDQDNLLVADNRTRQWINALPADRVRLSGLAWGDVSLGD